EAGGTSGRRRRADACARARARAAAGRGDRAGQRAHAGAGDRPREAGRRSRVIELGLFWACCLLAVCGALGAALLRNLFHAALLPGLCLAGVAGLYLFLEAHYLACIQVVVYIGGILVLTLFATLFSADIMGATQRPALWLRAAGWIGAVLAAGVGWRLAQVAM